MRIKLSTGPTVSTALVSVGPVAHESDYPRQARQPRYKPRVPSDISHGIWNLVPKNRGVYVGHLLSDVDRSLHYSSEICMALKQIDYRYIKAHPQRLNGFAKRLHSNNLEDIPLVASRRRIHLSHDQFLNDFDRYAVVADGKLAHLSLRAIRRARGRLSSRHANTNLDRAPLEVESTQRNTPSSSTAIALYAPQDTSHSAVDLTFGTAIRSGRLEGSARLAHPPMLGCGA